MRLANFVQFQVVPNRAAAPIIWGLDATGQLWRCREDVGEWTKFTGPERAEPVSARDLLFKLNARLKRVNNEIAKRDAFDVGVSDHVKERDEIVAQIQNVIEAG